MSERRDAAGRWLRDALTGWQRPTGRPVDQTGESAGSLIGFVATAGVVGALTGLAASSFGIVLGHLARLREHFADSANDAWWTSLLVIGLCACAAAAAASLVYRLEPNAEGSGIPRVEAVVAGRADPGRFRILPIKYVGGLLSIGSGMALGREGPSVQMGGSVAVIVASLSRRPPADLRVLAAAGAAAGLATAFNAPIAGGVFILEELVRRFDPRTTIATLVASASGFAVAYQFSGSETNFAMPPIADPSIGNFGWVLAVGLVAGAFGVFYNRAIMVGLRMADNSRLAPEVRAGLIGAGVGVVVVVAPSLAGGGDELTQDALLGHGTIAATIAVLVIRVVLGVASYAAGTPGGLFAPMLVLGADAGLIIGLIGVAVDADTAPAPAALALIGMAAFFTASVHAPITGLILATEMTGTTNQLPPMLGACAVAFLVAVAFRSRGVYVLLAERASARAEADAAPGVGK